MFWPPSLTPLESGVTDASGGAVFNKMGEAGSDGASPVGTTRKGNRTGEPFKHQKRALSLRSRHFRTVNNSFAHFSNYVETCTTRLAPEKSAAAPCLLISAQLRNFVFLEKVSSKGYIIYMLFKEILSVFEVEPLAFDIIFLRMNLKLQRHNKK